MWCTRKWGRRGVRTGPWGSVKGVARSPKASSAELSGWENGLEVCHTQAGRQHMHAYPPYLGSTCVPPT